MSMNPLQSFAVLILVIIGSGALTVLWNELRK